MILRIITESKIFSEFVTLEHGYYIVDLERELAYLKRMRDLYMKKYKENGNRYIEGYFQGRISDLDAQIAEIEILLELGYKTTLCVLNSLGDYSCYNTTLSAGELDNVLKNIIVEKKQSDPIVITINNLDRKITIE